MKSSALFAPFSLRLKLRLTITVMLVVLIYNEWLSNKMSRQYWVDLYGNNVSDEKDDVRLLLVADPQLLGFLMEPSGLMGLLTRWDADRFLRKSFESAVTFVNPHVVLFLGDLTDEGSIASKSDFDQYKSRFLNTFKLSNTVKVISIPGDNDIGGEGSDLVTEDKSRRFQDAFGRDTYIQYKFIEFIKINLLTNSNDFKDIPVKQKDKVRIIVTHVPLLPSRDSIVQNVVSELNPDLVISAHEHVARLMESGRDSVRLRSIDSMKQKGRVWRIDSRHRNVDGGGLFEIQVPTCSYRMGVPRSGYGSALIDRDGQIEYTILWSAGRFPQLYLYILVMFIIAILFVPSLIYQCWLLNVHWCFRSTPLCKSQVLKC